MLDDFVYSAPFETGATVVAFACSDGSASKSDTCLPVGVGAAFWPLRPRTIGARATRSSADFRRASEFDAFRLIQRIPTRGAETARVTHVSRGGPTRHFSIHFVARAPRSAASTFDEACRMCARVQFQTFVPMRLRRPVRRERAVDTDRDRNARAIARARRRRRARFPSMAQKT